MKPVTRRALLIFGCAAGGTLIGGGIGALAGQQAAEDNFNDMAAYSADKVDHYKNAGMNTRLTEAMRGIHYDVLAAVKKISEAHLKQTAVLGGAFGGGAVGLLMGLREAFRGSVEPETKRNAEIKLASSPAGPQPLN